MPSGAFRVGVVDMNAGPQNQAIRCMGVLIDQFAARVRAVNPGLAFERVPAHLRLSIASDVTTFSDETVVYFTARPPNGPLAMRLCRPLKIEVV